MTFTKPKNFSKKKHPTMDSKKAAVKAAALKEASERSLSTSSEDWSEVEYGPGWEKVFDPSPANVTEQQMKAT